MGVDAGGVPPLIATYLANPKPDPFNIVMGGPAAGCLLRIASASTANLAMIVRGGAMEALVCMLRQYAINDDTEEDVPATRQKMQYMEQIKQWEAGTDSDSD